jgi:hypothetical protein
MPKRFSVPLTTYEPNLDGSPRVLPDMSLDEITRNNTDCIDFQATVRPDWAPDTLLFELQVFWSDGSASGWQVSGGLLKLDGTPETVWTARTYVPREGTGGKASVASGIVRITIHAPFSSAFEAEAKAL